MTVIDRSFEAAVRYQTPDCDPYEVYALRYAERPGTRAQNFLEWPKVAGPQPLDYFSWLIRNKDRTILVDTGFSREIAERLGRTFLRCPVRSWEVLGVDVNEIEHVVITHLHNDHAANTELLPKARFHLQDSEMAYATGRHMGFPCCGAPVDRESVVDFVRLVYAGRVEFHNGSDTIAPGVSLHLVGGHTAGLQAVRVWTRKGWLVLASDATHFYENFETEKPFHLVYDTGQMVDGFRMLRQMASAPELIIPGHDPLVMERFPKASDELDGAIVRLD